MVEKKSGQGKPCQSFFQLYVPFASQNMDYAGLSPIGNFIAKLKDRH